MESGIQPKAQVVERDLAIEPVGKRLDNLPLERRRTQRHRCSEDDERDRQRGYQCNERPDPAAPVDHCDWLSRKYADSGLGFPDGPAQRPSAYTSGVPLPKRHDLPALGVTAFAAQLDLLSFLLADFAAVFAPFPAFFHHTAARWVRTFLNVGHDDLPAACGRSLHEDVAITAGDER